MHRFLRGTLDFRSYDKEIVVNSFEFSSSGDYAVFDFENSPNAEYEFKAKLELGATAPGFNLVSLNDYPLKDYQDCQVQISLNRKAMRFLYDSAGKSHAFISGFWHESLKGKQTDYYFSGLLEAEDAAGSRLSQKREIEFLSKIQTKLSRKSAHNLPGEA